MDNITISKHQVKRSKNYISNIFSKLLISVIFILSSLIFTNLSTKNYALYKNNVINNNFRFTKIRNIYEKYLGKTLPKTLSSEKSVFSESKLYDNIKPYGEGEKIIFKDHTLVEAMQSGIVVFMGDKENLGYTVIVQGIDDVDIWYSNISNCNLKLYDYVEKNNVVGEVDKELIINIVKEKEHLKYEEYLQTL